MTSDLDRMILAARQIGEVVGEDIINKDGLWIEGGRLYIGEQTEPIPGVPQRNIRCSDGIALSIIRDRVWEALRKACIAFNWQEDTDMGEHIAVWYAANGDAFMAPDLPSAVAAIHKHHMENRNA